MLIGLSIRDFVLIERLDLELAPGLCVLTGETGAGKSILLDALGLALGRRAERGLVRRGCRQSSVSAVFAIAERAPVRELLDEHGLEVDDELVVRRVLGADGRSRAFVNDQPTSGTLLQRLGDLLVEVHGQQEQQALLEPMIQRRLLDAYGRSQTRCAAVGRSHAAWREAEATRREILDQVERATAEESYLRHVFAELEELAPEPGEEEALVEARARLMNREKLAQAIDEAGGLLRDGIIGRLATALRTLERAAPNAGGLLEPAAAALDRTRVELDEAIDAIARAGDALEHENERLESVEERLFALRAAARKHRVAVDDLAELQVDFARRLALIDSAGDRLVAAEHATADARAAFEAAAQQLTRERQTSAARLARAVMAELPPLRLDKAKFEVGLVSLAEEDWSADGAERITFEIATNPGELPGPLAKVASGGELARFMLALKVVLARVGSTPTLIFDEVDSGVGGATADAVGERLARLAEAVQVLVVTHAPQVAARADQHLLVEKSTRGERARISVAPLEGTTRREEIARMLAGAQVTEAARAAADSLIEQSA